MTKDRARFYFYCDENFPEHVGKFLKSQRNKVTYATKRKIRGTSDIEQLEHAIKINAIFLTNDADFKNYSFPTEVIEKSLGVIIFKTNIPTERQYQEIAEKLLKILTINKIKSKICYASIEQIKFIKPQDLQK